MAPKYKLIYFNLKGLGEQIRFLLAFMEEDYEDVRIEEEDWLKMKSTTPFGKLPLLEEEGRPLTQSMAIARYLGRRAGLAEAGPWESLQEDIIADTLNDMRLPMSAYFYETNEDLKNAKKKTYIEETLTFYLSKLEAIVAENGGYLANKKLSWVDFVFASLTELISFGIGKENITENYPELHALRDKIFNIPQIKKWRETRPVTLY